MAPQFSCCDLRNTARRRIRNQCHLDFDLCHRWSSKYALDGKEICLAKQCCGSAGHSINSQPQSAMALDDLINLAPLLIASLPSQIVQVCNLLIRAHNFLFYTLDVFMVSPFWDEAEEM